MRDPRWLRSGVLALGFGALAAILHAILTGATGLWTALQIWPMQPIFADLRTVPLPSELSGADALALVRLESPADPWGRVFNYPEVWSWLMVPFAACPDRNLCLGLLLLALLTAAYVAASLTLRDRVMLGLLPVFFLSPPVFLLIERGNNDSVVFLLLLVAVGIGSAFARGLLTGVAGGLKVFPVAALIAQPRYFRSLPWLAGVALSLPLLLWALSDLQAIRSATPVGATRAFGVASLGKLAFLLAERYALLIPKALAEPATIVA